MRIVMLGVKGLPGTFGGVERHVEELGAELVARGHEVTVYVRRFYTPQEIVVRGVQTKLLPTIHTKHLDTTVHVLLSAFKAGFEPFDVAHYHGIGPGCFCPITRLLGKPSVVTIHSLDYLRDKWSPGAKWALRQAERVSARCASRLICVSPSITARHAQSGRPVAHIPNGVSQPQPRPPLLIKEKYGLNGGDYVLYVGRISPEKGVHYLVRAFKQIPGDRRLVVVGGTSHTDAYVRGLENEKDARTIMTGYLEGEILAELYTNAAAFVLPSEHEGMPVALLEAWSYGRPCLVSDIGPCRDVGGPDGQYCRYFITKDTDDLARQLSALLNDPAAVGMAEAARQHVLAHYGWPAIAARVEEQYRLAVEHR